MHVRKERDMRFQKPIIELAKRLRDLGLVWEPMPGHYVWDEAGLIEKASPFQEGVYFILDINHFLRRAGSLDAMKRSLIWLPTWHDARDVLQTLGVSDAEVASRLASKEAIEHRAELMVLYELIAETLGRSID
jgi:hypothetical protein